MRHWISLLFNITEFGDCWLVKDHHKRPYVRGYIGSESHGTTAGHFICSVTNGPCPEGHQAAHSCHNPLCVRPDHLSWQPVDINSVEHLPFKLGRVEAAREASKLGVSRLLENRGKSQADRGISCVNGVLKCRIRVGGVSYTKQGLPLEELREWRDKMLSKLGVT